MKPLSNLAIDKILSKRTTADERRQFRDRADARYQTKGNRNVPAANPYAKALEGLDPYSRAPADQRQYERIKRLHDNRAAELDADAAVRARRLVNEDDDDIQNATLHLSNVIAQFKSETPEDVRDRGAAMAALDRALTGDGDKIENLSEMYRATRSIADRIFEADEPVLNEARATCAAAKEDEARLEMINARRQAAAIQPPLLPDGDRTSLDTAVDRLDPQ
jgi:hypothetical protein